MELKKRKGLKMMTKIKNKILSLLPVSRRTFNEYEDAVLEILGAHKEMQLLNRQDIMMIAKELAVKTSNAQQEKKPVTKPIQDKMFG